MKKDLKTLALARLSGFRHKTVKVPEWGNVSVVLREPSAEAWYLWQEVLNGDGEDDDTLSVVAKTRRNLEADVTLFCDVLCDTDLQRVFTPDDREQVLAVYGPVHARLLRQALLPWQRRRQMLRFRCNVRRRLTLWRQNVPGNWHRQNSPWPEIPVRRRWSHRMPSQNVGP